MLAVRVPSASDVRPDGSDADDMCRTFARDESVVNVDRTACVGVVGRAAEAPASSRNDGEPCMAESGVVGSVCTRARDDDAAVGDAYVGEPDGETDRTGCVTVRARGTAPTSDNDGIDRFRDRPGIGGGAAYAACSNGVDFLCRSELCRVAVGAGLIVVAIDGSG